MNKLYSFSSVMLSFALIFAAAFPAASLRSENPRLSHSFRTPASRSDHYPDLFPAAGVTGSVRRLHSPGGDGATDRRVASMSDTTYMGRILADASGDFCTVALVASDTIALSAFCALAHNPTAFVLFQRPNFRASNRIPFSFVRGRQARFVRPAAAALANRPLVRFAKLAERPPPWVESITVPHGLAFLPEQSPLRVVAFKDSTQALPEHIDVLVAKSSVVSVSRLNSDIQLNIVKTSRMCFSLAGEGPIIRATSDKKALLVGWNYPMTKLSVRNQHSSHFYVGQKNLQKASPKIIARKALAVVRFQDLPHSSSRRRWKKPPRNGDGDDDGIGDGPDSGNYDGEPDVTPISFRILRNATVFVVIVGAIGTSALCMCRAWLCFTQRKRLQEQWRESKPEWYYSLRDFLNVPNSENETTQASSPQRAFSHSDQVDSSLIVLQENRSNPGENDLQHSQEGNDTNPFASQTDVPHHVSQVATAGPSKDIIPPWQSFKK